MDIQLLNAAFEDRQRVKRTRREDREGFKEARQPVRKSSEDTRTGSQIICSVHLPSVNAAARINAACGINGLSMRTTSEQCPAGSREGGDC